MTKPKPKDVEGRIIKEYERRDQFLSEGLVRDLYHNGILYVRKKEIVEEIKQKLPTATVEYDDGWYTLNFERPVKPNKIDDKRGTKKGTKFRSKKSK